MPTRQVPSIAYPTVYAEMTGAEDVDVLGCGLTTLKYVSYVDRRNVSRSGVGRPNSAVTTPDVLEEYADASVQGASVLRPRQSTGYGIISLCLG